MQVSLVLVPGNNIRLLCQAHSNLAQVHWRFSGQTLHPNDKYCIYNWGLLIVNATTSDAGLYICDSVEQIASKPYKRTVGAYQLQSRVGRTNIFKSDLDANQDDLDLFAESQSRMTGLEVAVILLSLICVSLMTVVIWVWSKGHLQCLKSAQSTSQTQVERPIVDYLLIQNRTSAKRPHRPQSVRPLNANNNHSEVDFEEAGGQPSRQMPNISTLEGLGYIHDESEI